MDHAQGDSRRARVKRLNWYLLNRNRPNKSRLAKGVLTLELVLALPIMLAVILALVEVGTYLLAVQAIQGAAMVECGRQVYRRRRRTEFRQR